MRNLQLVILLCVGFMLCASARRSYADGLPLTEAPAQIDVILSMDNSGSMNAETIAFQAAVATLASSLSGAGVDYRIIVVSEFGDNASESYCFPPPVGGGPCAGAVMPIETSTFKHYSVAIASHNMWCRLLETFAQPDAFGLHPTGWQDSLRLDSHKVFILVTDDGVSCISSGTVYLDNDNVLDGESAAQLFDAALLALSPAHFGTAMDRKYRVHSILGLTANMPSATWLPLDPIVVGTCPSAVDAGTGHQAWSRMTEGLRYPTCEDASYGLFMNLISDDAIAWADSQVGQYALPAGLPIGVDPATLLIEFDPNDGGPLIILEQDSGGCAGETFTVSASTISLCPLAQTLVDGFANPILRLLYVDPASPVLCSGDGGDQLGCTDCPCMNNAAVGTIGGCLNSAGTSVRLISCGDTSVTIPLLFTTDLRFSLTGCPPLAFCILNSGDSVAPGGMANPCFGLNSGGQAAAFDGLRCAIVNTRRHGGRSADVNGDVGVTNSPWGGEGGPPAGLAIAGGGFVSGQTRYFQVINRDDVTLSCMRGLNTSQAIEITFQP